jgi:undecaprenyl phosphate-alpha-L-ara4FN deformylase
MKIEVALKVDVDTYLGARDGVPRLARLLEELRINASFFVTMGPDNSGKAIRRVLRKGFLAKMIRTRAPGLYGWRTLLFGTLLPAPLVGSAFPEMLKRLEGQGNEIGPHGWDHVYWHDSVRRMSAGATFREFERGYQACSNALGHKLTGSAAPGWQCTANSLEAQDNLELLYHSDTRGVCPFFPCMNGRLFRAIEIPTTLPTLDEVLGTPRFKEVGFVRFFDALLREGSLNVFTVHAESEGGNFADHFRELLLRWQERGVSFLRLTDIARRLTTSGSTLPKAEIVWGSVPGRAGSVACQCSRSHYV